MKTQTYEKSLEYLKFDNPNHILWRGQVSEIAQGIGETNIQNVYNALKILDDLECVHRLTRGNAHFPPSYLLVRAPTVEDFFKFRERAMVVGRNKIPNAAARTRASLVTVYREFSELRERVELLEATITKLEKNVERLDSVIEGTEVRSSSG